MVVMSLETYSDIINNIEAKLDEADFQTKIQMFVYLTMKYLVK